MTAIGKKEALILFVGDIIFFLISLWITLFIRYFAIPSWSLFYNHVVPFSLLFIVWILVFFIAGLYGKHTLLLKRKLPSIILNAQVINVVLAAIFFFFIPYFGIAPKTNLFIYLIISFGFIVAWRLGIFPLLGIRKSKNGLLIGSKETILELQEEINENIRYNTKFVDVISLDEVSNGDLIKRVEEGVDKNGVSIIIVDTKDDRVLPVLPVLYSFLFSGVYIVDVSKVYEDIFDRVPLQFVKQNWLIDNVSLSSKPFYDLLKRTFDIFAALSAGIVSLLVYPFVIAAIKIEDGGSIFYSQDRIGKGGKNIKLIKFRTMSETEKEKVTRVGRILRKTSIDELPQLWTVVQGDLSLIGPRPETPTLVELYEKKIPYYNVRHLIKPGLSGWAQIHQIKPPKFGVQYDETIMKFSYDLYYTKYRSIIMDMQIVLRTIETILSFRGM